MNILEKAWIASLPERIARHAAASALLEKGRKAMSKRAIICRCGLAKPCDKPDCTHTSVGSLRRHGRINAAREAIEALKEGEWHDVMVGRCQFCGLKFPCECR